MQRPAGIQLLSATEVGRGFSCLQDSNSNAARFPVDVHLASPRRPLRTSGSLQLSDTEGLSDAEGAGEAAVPLTTRPTSAGGMVNAWRHAMAPFSNREAERLSEWRVTHGKACQQTDLPSLVRAMSATWARVYTSAMHCRLLESRFDQDAALPVAWHPDDLLLALAQPGGRVHVYDLRHIAMPDQGEVASMSWTSGPSSARHGPRKAAPGPAQLKQV